jgi:hypothetical protein
MAGDYYRDQRDEAEQFEIFIQQKLLEGLYKEFPGFNIARFTSQATQLAHGDLRMSAGCASESWDIEIKNDKQMVDTRRLYIETQEKSHPRNPDFIDSGIFASSSADLYGIGDECEFYLFDREALKDIAPPPDKWMTIDRGTSRGFLLEIKNLSTLGSPESEALWRVFRWPRR